VKPGGGRVELCLRRNAEKLSPGYVGGVHAVRHEDDLSTSCRSQTERFQVAWEKVLAARAACKADVERLCEGVPPQVGPLVECSQEHKTNLSATFFLPFILRSFLR